MPENDRLRRWAGVKSVLKALAIVIATAAATAVLCFRSGRSTEGRPEVVRGRDDIAVVEQLLSVDQDDRSSQESSVSVESGTQLRNVPNKRTTPTADKRSTEPQDGWAGGGGHRDWYYEYNNGGDRPAADSVDLTTGLGAAEQPTSAAGPHRYFYGWLPANPPPPSNVDGDSPPTQQQAPVQQAPAVQQAPNAVDWRSVGAAALVKSALFALNTFVVVNAALLLLFKAALAFLKFQLLFKSAGVAYAAVTAVPSLLLASLLSPTAFLSPANSFPANPQNPPDPPNQPDPPRPDQKVISDDYEWRRRDHSADAVFRKLLESEKCVQRIACRMALAQRAGAAVPFWMNWIINDVSKVIPNENLEEYFKTYRDVNNTIKTDESAAPHTNNWATWCAERYKCNNADVLAKAKK